MKINLAILNSGLFFLIVLIFCSSFKHINTPWISEYKKIKYQIQSNSVLEINGRTNINSFSCTSSEQFQNKDVTFKFEAENSTIYFQDMKFNLQINQLDCGNKKINKDLFKALKVTEYPNITIYLKEALNIECRDLSICGEWMEFEANTDITITCETESFRIPILVKKLDNESYRITGGTTLQLCDFDIKAPTAMLGLIKVKDAIELNFDLYIDVNT